MLPIVCMVCMTVARWQILTFPCLNQQKQISKIEYENLIRQTGIFHHISQLEVEQTFKPALLGAMLVTVNGVMCLNQSHAFVSDVIDKSVKPIRFLSYIGVILCFLYTYHNVFTEIVPPDPPPHRPTLSQAPEGVGLQRLLSNISL